MDIENPARLSDSLSSAEFAFFALYIGVLLIALVCGLRSRTYRESLSIFTVILGIGIYFHAEILEQRTLVNARKTKMIATGSDPIAEHRSYARYHTKLLAFRSVAYFAVMLGGTGFVISRLSNRRDEQGAAPNP